ncbi:MAG: hypothetical protein ABIV47_10650 [Roseiflexaceae bacterium]
MIIRSIYHIQPAGSDFLVQTDYTVYASGRVAASMSFINQSGASRTLSNIEYAFTNVEDSLVWNVSTINSGNGIGFLRTSGTTPLPNLLLVNYSADTTTDTDGTGNRYWYVTNQILAANAAFSRQWEMQLGPGGQTTTTLATRTTDARTPGLTVVSGGTAGAYSTAQAAYTLQASGASVSFYPTAAQQRHTPIFVINNWLNPTWQVSLNGVVQASSTSPQTSQAVVSYDAANQRLIIQYLGTIPTTATTAQRTFVVSSN